MTYITGGNIQATDYNTFATLSTGVNELFADSNSGATLLPAAGLGYGQTALSSVAASTNVTAAQWSSLFENMRSAGTHQGTVVSPPIPVSGPVAGDTIATVTTDANFQTLISTLKTNSFNIAGGQTSVIAGTGFSNPAPWTTSLVYTFQVDFGSWNNARYFFNTGGQISITGEYTPNPAGTPDEQAWADMFQGVSANFPVNMNWQTVTSLSGGNLIANPAGFYLSAPYPGLTTAYQSIYQKYAGIPFYATNYALIEAKLANTAGTDGKIDFSISLIDGSFAPPVKAASGMTFTINRIQSAGTVPYSGGYTYTSGGFVAS